MKGRRSVRCLVLVLATGLAVSAFAKSEGVEFPDKSRMWTHGKSMVIADKEHPLYGFHHIYVNDKALETYRKGQGAYPKGAELAVVFYEVDQKDRTIMQGEKIMTAVMKKDKEATETGGWNYAAFDPAGKALEIDVKKECYECHTQARETDYVFSTFLP